MPAPLSASDILADESTKHVFALLRVAGGFRQDALGYLESMLRELTDHAAKYGGLPGPRGQKYNALEKEAKGIIEGAYALIQRGQMGELEKLAQVEAKAIPAQLNKAIGVSILSNKIPVDVLNAIVRGKILEGHPLSDHWAKQSANLRRAFTGQVAQGLLLGESVGQITQRITGKNGVGGIGPVAKRDATTLVRTSVMAVTNGVKLEAFQRMETVKGIQWLSTLDNRTTLICISLDGKQWRFPDFKPVGHNKKFPGPTAHPNCRSTQTAVTYTWSELAGKKIPEADNQSVSDAIRAKMKDAGASEEEVAGALARARASIDGPVRGTMTYDDWAKDKSPAELAQIIGRGRAELYNAGKITLTDLTDQNNRPLTVAQLHDAVTRGTLPRETEGTTFIPYKSAKTAKAADLQDVAAAARRDAEEKAARADRLARDTLDELATTNAATFGGPFADAKAAMEHAAEGSTTSALRDTYDKVTQQAAPDWLNAWKGGYASPHLEDPTFSATRQAAWEKYAKDRPQTPETWQAMVTGHANEFPASKVLAEVERANAEVQRRTQVLQAALAKGDTHATQGALLDLQAAIEHVRTLTAEPDTTGTAAAPKAVDIKTVTDRENAVALELKVRGEELTTKQKRALAKFAATDNAAYEKMYDEIAADVVAGRRTNTAQLIEEARGLPTRQHPHPVADAFNPDQFRDKLRAAEFEHALSQIARIHGDGALPKIPIKSVTEWYDMMVQLGKNPALNVSSHDQSIAFTATHEVGHVLDWYALGNGKGFGSETNKAKGVMDAIKQSGAYQRVKDLGKAKAPTPALADHQEYLARDHEIFARAYSQYIATKSNDPLLLRQFRTDQREMYGEAMYWTDSEFQAISTAFDELFAKLGW